MTDIPALNIDAIKARAEAAQPGPWWWGGNVDHHGDVGLRGASTGHGVMDVMRTSPENVDEESAGKEWDTSDASDYIGRDEYIEMRTQNPQHHLCFLRADAMFVEPGRDVAIFEVAQNQKLPDDTPRDHPKVYRGDVVGVRNPNADFIAHAREDIPALLAALAEQSQLRETAELELVEAHHHFGIQEGRIAAAWDEGAQHVYEGTAPKCEFAKDREPCPYNPYRAAATTEGESDE